MKPFVHPGLLLTLLVLSTVLSACHEDDEDSSSAATAYYIDDPVQGLYYEVTNGSTRISGGTTGANGNINLPGDQAFTLRIFLGNNAADANDRLILNSFSLTQAEAQSLVNTGLNPVITPYTGQSRNIALEISRFLQLLDASADDRIIEISAAVHSDIMGHSELSGRSSVLQVNTDVVSNFSSILPVAANTISSVQAESDLNRNLRCALAAAYRIDGRNSDASFYGAISIETDGSVDGFLLRGQGTADEDRELLNGELRFTAGVIQLYITGEDDQIFTPEQTWLGNFTADWAQSVRASNTDLDLVFERAEQRRNLFPDWRIVDVFTADSVVYIIDLEINSTRVEGYLYRAETENDAGQRITGSRDSGSDNRYSATDTAGNSYVIVIRSSDAQRSSTVELTYTYNDSSNTETDLQIQPRACRP